MTAIKDFTRLYLFVFCATSFIFCSLLYPIMLKAQPPRIPDKEVERIVQNFEQVELNDLLKDESLQAECNQFLITKLKNFDWMMPIIGSKSDMHIRCINLELRMEKLLKKVTIVKKSEQGNLDAQLYLAAEKLANMLALADFRQTFDKFEQIQRDDLWNVSVFTGFVGFYLKVKYERDFIFFQSDSLYRLERKAHDIYIDRINKIALSLVEWVEGLEFETLKSEENNDFLEKYNEFLKSLNP